MAITRLGPTALPLGSGGNFAFKQPGLGDIMALVQSVELDLTPPHPVRETVEFQRWMHENLFRVKEIIRPLDSGQEIDGTFTTQDGKTVTVVDGVITKIV